MEPYNPEQIEANREAAARDLAGAEEWILIVHNPDEEVPQMATHIVTSIQHMGCFMEEIETVRLSLVYQSLGQFLASRGVRGHVLSEDDIRSFLDSLDTDDSDPTDTPSE